ncbi:MAG: MFS transporter, partial [Armatimonadota bacterium]
MIQRPDSETVPSDPGWRRNLVILWGAEFTAVAGMSTVIPFIPRYVRELGVGAAESIALWSGIIVAGNFASSAIMSPIWGNLADRHGRKIMVVRALLGLSLACTLMGLAQSAWHLLVARLVQGALGGSVAAANALVASTSPRDRLGSSLGSLQAAFMSGACIGPAAGGLLADWLGHRAVFFIAATLCLLATFVVAFGVRERFVPTSPAERVSFGRNMRILAQSRTLRILFGSVLLSQFALMMLNPLLPMYVEQLAGDGKHISTLVGFVFAAPALATVVASPLWGRKGDRSNTGMLLPWVLIGVGAAYVPAAFVTTVAQLVGIRAVMGVFAGGVLPTVNAVATKAAHHRQTASALSFVAVAQLVGKVSGPVVGGALVAVMALRPVFIIASLICAISASVAVPLGEAGQRTPVLDPTRRPEI